MPRREVLERLKQRVLDRLRDEPNIDWLVARGLSLGTGTHIGHPLYIDRLHPWLITIGDYVDLSPYVALVTHDPTLRQHTGQTRIGRVDIADRVSVGIGAIILPGTSIGEDSVIAAGAVVRGDIPPGSMVIGNPATTSPVKAAAAWQRVNAASAPSWPVEGWSLRTGITEERKREQREALANCASGYFPARAAPGSPFARAQERGRAAGSASGPPRVSATSGPDSTMPG